MHNDSIDYESHEFNNDPECQYYGTAGLHILIYVGWAWPHDYLLHDFFGFDYPKIRYGILSYPWKRE